MSKIERGASFQQASKSSQLLRRRFLVIMIQPALLLEVVVELHQIIDVGVDPPIWVRSRSPPEPCPICPRMPPTVEVERAGCPMACVVILTSCERRVNPKRCQFHLLSPVSSYVSSSLLIFAKAASIASSVDQLLSSMIFGFIIHDASSRSLACHSWNSRFSKVTYCFTPLPPACSLTPVE